MKSKILTLMSAAVIAAISCSASRDGSSSVVLDQWMFSKDSVSWEPVNVPHSYNAIDGHSQSYYRGKAYYSTDINLSRKNLSGSVQLFFEGAAQAAYVYVGSECVAIHKGGYTPFFVDITDAANVGRNTITVVCDNHEDINLAPVQSDFNKNGGLHNPVTLHLFNDAYFSTKMYGLHRMHVSTPEVSAMASSVEVAALLEGKDGEYEIRTVIKDGDGNVAGENREFMVLRGEAQICHHYEINSPHLWNGVKDPYLYTAEIEVLKNGKLVDHTSSRFGIRYFRMDQKEGFFLNGEHYPLRGTSIHQDIENKASALSYEDYRNDYEIVRELGCNFVRLAHYPHNDYAFELCDEIGLIVQTEIPWVNICGVNAEQEYFDNLHQQMSEMITSLYNHPSIVFWGMWNELDTWSNSSRYQGAFDSKRVLEQTASLYDLAKSLDPARLVGVTDDCILARDGYLELKADYISENRYNGWYYGAFNDLTPEIKWLNDKGFTVNISEYGAGVNPFCHTWKAEDISNKVNEKHFEEWGNLFHESHLAQIEQMPFLNFTSIWILFDFPVASRTEGYLDSNDGIEFTENEYRKYTNDKGLVTRDRAIKKDVFYLYKSKWNHNEETVYITGRRLDYVPAGEKYEIKVYSNASSLTLFKGDAQIQSLASSGEITGVIWKFDPIEITDGDNVFTVVSDSGKKDTVTIASEAV